MSEVEKINNRIDEIVERELDLGEMISVMKQAGILSGVFGATNPINPEYDICKELKALRIEREELESRRKELE